METHPPISTKSKTFVDRVEPALLDIDHKSFSPAAFSALKARVAQYIDELVGESANARKLDRSDIISVKHIESAVDHLKQSNRRRIYKQSGTLGGVLLGACLSSLYSMITSNQPTTAGVIFLVTSGIGGTAFSMISYMNE